MTQRQQLTSTNAATFVTLEAEIGYLNSIIRSDLGNWWRKTLL